MTEPTQNVPLSQRERDLLLAAVRLWQAWQFPNECAIGVRVTIPPAMGEALLDIADNGRGEDARPGMVHLNRLALRLGGA